MTNTNVATPKDRDLPVLLAILCMSLFDVAPLAEHYGPACGIAACAAAYVVFLAIYRKITAVVASQRKISDDLRICIKSIGILVCMAITLLWVTGTDIVLGWY